jgi:malonyl-CoA O-methyltransferase
MRRAAAGGVFVTGTGTGIGKTVVSACLVRRWQAEYWKPVQTGIAEDVADSETVASLSGATAIHPPRHVFRAPLSPEAAASLEGATLRLTDFNLPVSAGPIVVEGAGGVLVPLNAECLMVDLMVRLALPVVLVAATGLGTINHTLLSLAALRARHLAIAGVVLAGPDNAGNAEAIERHGQVRILHRLPPLSPLTSASLREAAAAFPAYEEVAA